MLEYVNLDQLLPMVLRDCPNVPRAVALFEIRQATIKFCRESRCWREDIVPFNTDPNVAITQYEFFTQAPESRPVYVLSLQADGKNLEPRTEDELDRTDNNWRARAGQPSGFIAVSPAWVRPFPIASSQSVRITGKAVVAPEAAGNFVLKDVFDDYAPSIASLAKGSLMKMPGKPWSNEKLSVFETSIGESAISGAKAQASRNFSAAPKRRVKAHYF